MNTVTTSLVAAGSALAIAAGAFAVGYSTTSSAAAPLTVNTQNCTAPPTRPPTNTVELGSVYGSNLTAANNSRPAFWIASDGNKASYSISIDGTNIGTFVSDLYANVCVFAPNDLADGPHVLTGTEIGPTAGASLIPNPFAFTVDTVPPAPPSTPVLASYSDSGTKGDNSTVYNNPAFVGTTAADGRTITLLCDGNAGCGGGLAATTAPYAWTVRTIPLTVGTHDIKAVATDPAGNLSGPSGSLSLTIETPPVTTTTTRSTTTTTAGPTTTTVAPATTTSSTSTSTSTTTTTVVLNNTPCTVQTVGTGFCTGTFSR